MDIIKTAREIGLFETALNMSAVADSLQACSKIEESMPMPDANIASRIDGVVDYLLQFQKSKLLLLSPEIALLDALIAKDCIGIQVILAIPCDMDCESKERLKNNIPPGISVQVLDEPYFPEGFTPTDGLIASFGYSAGDHLMVLPECYRMTDHYSGFWGKKVFIPYTVSNSTVRHPGWMEVNAGKFSDVWRNEE